MVKLTKAQIVALRMVENRDWPAGEPRRSWFNEATLAAIERLDLVEERFPNIIHLTDAGRAALERSEGSPRPVDMGDENV